ncbi:MAG: hypothetical protein IK990_16065 [Ruminiclostridium sp.]|nr:hypothetical protein [Ruminiclostridium sp.]
MAEVKIKRSGFFDIPDLSMFIEGNTFVGSENTFNFRIKPKDDRLLSDIWYGELCSDLSEMTDEHEEEKSEDGLTALVRHIDDEYVKYMKLVESGEVRGRRTYKLGAQTGSTSPDPR